MKGFLRRPWVQAVLGRILAGYLILIRRTTRWRHEGVEALEPMFATGQGAIGLLWHGRIPISLGVAATWWRKDSRRCLISPSSDGEFVALALEYAGFPAIRMSTAKKGDSAKARAAVAAFREAVQHVAGGGVLIITMVAAPFGRGVCIWEGPFHVPADAGEAEIDALRADLSARLSAATRRAESLVGRASVDPAPGG